MNEARQRVTLHCTKTKQNFKLKLDPNGNLCLSCLKDFGIDAIGVRYKVINSDECMIIPAEPNGLIEQPEEGWDGLNLEICHRLSDTREYYQSVDQIANMSYPTEEDKFVKEEPDLETFNIDQERDYNESMHQSFPTPESLAFHSPELSLTSIESELFQKRKKSEYSFKAEEEEPSSSLALGKLPFQCPHCLRQISDRKNLNHHIRRIHKNVRNYECQICKKKFYMPYELRKHKCSLVVNSSIRI